MLTPLRNWHNKRIREMCRVTMHQVELYSINSVKLQKRIGIWDLDYYVGRRTLQWVGHVACMDKSRTRTRTNADPNGTEANAAGRSSRACVARESELEESWVVSGRAMCPMSGRS